MRNVAVGASIARARKGGGLETHGQGGLLDAVGVPDVHPPLVHQSLSVDLLLRQAFVVGEEPAGGSGPEAMVGATRGFDFFTRGSWTPRPVAPVLDASHGPWWELVTVMSATRGRSATAFLRFIMVGDARPDPTAAACW